MATETSSTNSSPTRKYDVFLSFRGEDTRNSFTNYLYETLKEKGIYTYRDDEELKKGKTISPALLQAIRESRFAVTVLSKNYASSSWCLEELVEIVECKKKLGLIVLPVFYHVEPTEVRKQTGDFGKGFTKHESVFKNNINIGNVKRWKDALIEVASIAGWDMKNRHEAEVIREIVKEILKELNPTFSIGNKELVGMASRINKMNILLDIKLDDVRTIGVWGMGGIGKTTLARQVFKSIHDKFEASCFIDNVREEFEKNGILHLQNILYKTLVDSSGSIQNYEMGINLLRKRLNSRKVLIILDDVDNLKQIKALVGNGEQQNEWLGPGSRVIVTTRNKHLLKSYRGNNIYNVDKLTNDEALQLLCQKAFKDGNLLDEYIKLSDNVVEYAKGNPLALEVLGSFLLGRSVEEWSDTLAKLKEDLDKDIVRTLQISYDGLDNNEKKIFLDIACFFKGEDEYRVKKILESCGFHLEIGIKVLIEKSLITMVGDKLWMHDLLQQLGQDIVRREPFEEPGKRSRLWFHKDARDVFVNNTGTKAVQGIFFSLPENEELKLSIDPLLEMKRLRLLKIQNVKFPECVGYLSDELRLLEWHGYPQISMPPSFCPNQLVELNMSSSRIERLWKETTHPLKQLIFINLRNCNYLNQTPDFSKIPKLERLILEGCKKLSKVHPTIGELKHLVLLNLKGCESLKSLPRDINLKSLKTFVLSGCIKLCEFPEVKENMDHLSELYLDGTAIKELPISIECLTGLTLLNLRDCKNLLSLPNVICNLTSLKTLDISGCSHLDQLPKNVGSLEQLEELYASRTAIRTAPSSIVLLKNLKSLCFAECSDVAYRPWKSLFRSFLLPMEESISFRLPNSFSFGLSSLTSLRLRKCNLTEGAIPEDIGSMFSLEFLDLSENNFMSLPQSISQLSKLRVLRMVKCRNLLSLPKLPLSIKIVFALECPALNYPKDQLTIWTSDKGFSFIVCDKSFENGQARLKMQFEEHFEILYYNELRDFIHDGRILQMCFPCTTIPEWFHQQSTGSSITIQLPPESNGEMWIGFSLVVIFAIQKHDNFQEDWDLEGTFCHFYTDECCLGNPFTISFKGHSSIGTYGVWIYVPRKRFAEQLNKASHISAVVSTNGPDIKMEMCAMHVVFNQDVTEFSRKVAQMFGEILINLNSKQYNKKILLEAAKSETSAGPLDIQSNPYKGEDWRFKGSICSNSVEQDCRITESDFTSQARRNLQILVPILLERCNARNYGFVFQFPLKAIPTWFFHQSVAPFVVCYHPVDLVDKKHCLGFCLYAALTWPNNHLNSETPPACLKITLRAYGDDDDDDYIVENTILVKHQLVMLTTPRVLVGAQLNRCRLVLAEFTTSIPDVEVEMCGIRPIYEQDLENVTEMITDITLRSHLHFCYQEYSETVEDFPIALEFRQPIIMKLEIPFDLNSSKRKYESLQELLSSTQSFEQLSVSLCGCKKVGQCSSGSSYQVIQQSTSKDSRPACFINLQIMAETPVFLNYDSKKWQKILEDWLKYFMGFGSFITLICKWRVLAVLKPFNPFSSYNLCFPRKEIVEWFEDHKVSDQRSMKMELRPNLNTDRNWMGVALCAAFSVVEHPTAILDDISEISFDLLCHLKSEANCFHPPMFRMTKDIFKWLYLRGFIWLIYIPRCKLADCLNEQSYLDIKIDNESPGVVTKNLGVRLLYQQDVEGFTQSLSKCMNSFFDNLDLIRQYRNDEHVDCKVSQVGALVPELAEIARHCGLHG